MDLYNGRPCGSRETVLHDECRVLAVLGRFLTEQTQNIPNMLVPPEVGSSPLPGIASG